MHTQGQCGDAAWQLQGPGFDPGVSLHDLLVSVWVSAGLFGYLLLPQSMPVAKINYP